MDLRGSTGIFTSARRRPPRTARSEEQIHSRTPLCRRLVKPRINLDVNLHPDCPSLPGLGLGHWEVKICGLTALLLC